ncbi:MAG: hypothetical protein LBG10_02505 [Treponema sp.]|jgi:rare lipoprotein A|nr:hypothetical protein [Treponema sp.]
MKSLTAALFLGLFFSSFCFAQTQTGSASYNTSKNGVTIAHSSMSFGTRVRITNLRNNREVIATVDGRIPASDPRVADISAEAGDAIGMSPSGYTEVRLEQLVHQVSTAPDPAPAETVRTAPPPPAATTTVPPPVSNPPSSQTPEIQETRVVESIQLIAPPQPQYTVPAAGNQNCFFSPFCVVILILLIIVTLLLTAILFLLLNTTRRLPWWLWYYPVWVRRHIRYMKKRRQ